MKGIARRIFLLLTMPIVFILYVLLWCPLSYGILYLTGFITTAPIVLIIWLFTGKNIYDHKDKLFDLFLKKDRHGFYRHGDPCMPVKDLPKMYLNKINNIFDNSTKHNFKKSNDIEKDYLL